MKIYSIDNSSQINKQHYSASFRAIPPNFVTDTFEKISNPKNKAVYEQLVKIFKKQEQPESRLYIYDGIKGLKAAIEKAYKACLDSNGEVNDYALSTLYKLCYLKSDFDNPFAGINNAIHNYLSSFKEILTMWDGESKILDKTERCRTFEEEGLGQIAEIVETCKDKSGHHNKINLDLANWIEKNFNLTDRYILKFINACKDTKTGICREESIQIFKDFCRQGRHYWFLDLPNEDGVITETALKFLNDSLEVFEAKKNSESQQDRYHYNVYIEIVQDALKHAHGKDRDEIFKLIYENRDLLAKNRRGERMLPETADKITTDSYWNDIVNDYNINLTNLKALIDCYKENSPRSIIQNFYLLKDKNRIVNEQNKDCLKILTDDILWYGGEIDDITKFKEARNDNWIFNIDFCKKFAELCKKYAQNDEEIYGDSLITCLEYMKNKDDSINWEAADIVFPLVKKYFKSINVISSNSENTKKFLTNLSIIMRDENGDFCKAGMDKIRKVSEKYQDVIYLDENEVFTEIKMQEVFEKAKETNLYKADEMYNLLKQLQSKGKLTAEHFSTPVDEDENTLLMYIADIPYNTKYKYEYEQILKILKSTPDIDFEQQDKFGISFLEKIINSENFELLKLIKNKTIKYNPMLDYAYNGIQNQQFKEELKKIKLEFPELEKAVKLNSTEAFEKVKAQLYSPFCNSKKEIENLLNIATENKNFTILCFLKNLYLNM